MLSKLRKDYERNEVKYPAMWILFVHRLGHAIYYKHCPSVVKRLLLMPVNFANKLFVGLLFNVEIPFGAHIGGGLRIRHPHSIIINPHCTIGENCTIFHEVTIGTNEHSGRNIAATIGDNVYIGCGAKIIGDIIIEDDAKIGANAVVTKHIPKNSTVICRQTILNKPIESADKLAL